MFNQIRILTRAGIGNVLASSKAFGGNKKKKAVMIGLFIFLGVYIAALSGAFVYLIYTELFDAYGLAELRVFIPCLYFILASILSLITGIFSSQGFIFKSKDCDLLFSLPVSTKAVLISKFLIFYLYELIFSVATIGVANVVYIILDGVTLSGIITTIVGVFLTPILPMMIGTLIAYGISMLIRKSAHKNQITTILTIVFSLSLFAVIEIASFNSEGLIDYIIKNGGDLLKSFREYYFPAGWYLSAFSGEYLYLLLFIILNVVPLLLLLIIGRDYRTLVASFNAGGKKVRYEYTESSAKTKSVLLTCFAKEFKKLVTSSQYLMNCGIGVIMMFLGLFTLSNISESAPAELAFYVLLAELVVMGTMTSSSACSISLEAKTLWIYKTSPVNEKTVLTSKAMVNYALYIPSIIIVSVIGEIMYSFTLPQLLLLILLPSAAVLASSYLGLVINLALPKFNWTNEIYAIKQSASVLVAMLSMFLFNLTFIGLSVCLMIWKSANVDLLIGILFLLYLVIYAAAKRVTYTWGVRKFRSL